MVSIASQKAAAANLIVLSRLLCGEGRTVRFVVRRGDGYKKLLSDDTIGDDPRYPKEVVAEVLVIEAHDRTSVGYVSRANKEVHPGDRIEMRRGY